MNKSNFYIKPVTYHEVSHDIPKRLFAREFSKIVGSIYLRNDLAQRPEFIIQALLKRCPEGIVRGYAALSLRGYRLLDRPWTPIISTAKAKSHIPTQRGKILRRDDPPELHQLNGTRVVSDVQALLDVFSIQELTGFEEQIALIDHLARQNRQLIELINAEPQLKQHASYTNYYAESPQESILRVRLIKSGIRGFVPQIRVDCGSEHYFLDLADPVLKVGLEYNGAWHYNSDQRAEDAQRKNALTHAGWAVFEITAKMLSQTQEWENILAVVQRAQKHRLAERRKRLPYESAF